MLAKILLSKYCNKSSFFNVASTPFISHGWRGILSGRELLLTHLGKGIGDGDTISLWTDSWIHPPSNLKPCGPVFLPDMDLMVADILCRETKEWNIARVNHLLRELASHILEIKPSIMGVQDTYIWPLQNSGTYTGKSGYFSVQAIRNQSTNSLLVPDPWNWKKNIWSPHLLPKIKFFLWKVANDALPTGANLQKRGLLVNTTCPQCGEVETIARILLKCRFAVEVWDLGSWTTSIETTGDFTFKELLQASAHWTNLPPFGIIGNVLPWIIWTIWTSRNQFIFEKRITMPQEIILKAIISQREWDKSQLPQSAPVSKNLAPPPRFEQILKSLYERYQ